MNDTPVVFCIIDDDNSYRFLTNRLIEKLNFKNRVLLFSNGDEALEYLLANSSKVQALPNVIFLDINMPIMDGWEFLEEYAKLKPRLGKKITVYLISSSSNPTDIERARKISDVTDYIVKPITGDQLHALLDKFNEQSPDSLL